MALIISVYARRARVVAEREGRPVKAAMKHPRNLLVMCANRGGGSFFIDACALYTI